MTYNFTEEQLEWLAALESGEYEQGKNFLNKHNKTCCLGVACVLSETRLHIIKKENFGILYYDRNSFWAPRRIQQILGLHDSSGLIYLKDKPEDFNYDSLADANDNGKTFKEIAKFIREYPHAVFDK